MTYLLAVLLAPTFGAATESAPRLALVCAESNDLYHVLAKTDIQAARFDTVADAIDASPKGGGVLILADGYPDQHTKMNDRDLQAAAEKKLRLYIEYPSQLPGIKLGAPRETSWERGVVASDFFGDELAFQRILAIHGCRYLPVDASNPHLVVARVAGFDTAVFGIPKDASPILFEHPDLPALVSTTCLSRFVTARYAPSGAWETIWARILEWLSPGTALDSFKYTPTVRPSFSLGAPLPETVETNAFKRGVNWFFDAKLFVNPDWPDDRSSCPDRVGPMPGADWTIGDGSGGMLEGFNSTIHPDGSQNMRWWMRNDCMNEGMMALAFHAKLADDRQSRKTANNLGDFIYFECPATKGPRDDPQNPCFGLMSWDITENLGVFYGDDNARAMLAAIASSALLETDRWNKKMLRCMLANLRTTGRLGFRGGRIDAGPLIENGWQHYLERENTHYSPHYESYLWAVFLWAYHQTGYDMFLDRARNAVRMTMEAYPDQWRWTNGLQQERARMLLCLSWLVRVDDTPKHRAWLDKIASDLLASQDECGAIREELGKTGFGSFAPPASNKAYGTAEAPLIQKNGDPLCDLLYTTNFAFLGLHEAAAATGKPEYMRASDKLARFLCRIQIRSETHPELDGGWFRAFDFDRWEYWASNADLGWGAWSIESGWTCGWINAVLAMRHMNTSLWDLTQGSTIERHFDALQPLMLRGLE
ncbi:MAG: hypothetical protein R6V12_15920 [Candidatus Hydrogenedentota bacterium]